MLDMSWGEVMLIGGVALIVIGPKDLPKALRTVGQITRKVRRMAGEFQMQFNEAIREAELDDVRKDVDGIRNTIKGATGFNPVQTIRDEIKGAVEARSPKPTTQTLADATAHLRAAEGGTKATGGSYDVPTSIAPEPNTVDPFGPAAGPGAVAAEASAVPPKPAATPAEPTASDAGR